MIEELNNILKPVYFLTLNLHYIKLSMSEVMVLFIFYVEEKVLFNFKELHTKRNTIIQ